VRSYEEIRAAGRDQAAWEGDALCAQTDPGIMYPPKGDNTTLLVAKATCSLCEVAPECLSAALDSHDQYGIRGGKAPKPRAAIRRGGQTAVAAAVLNAERTRPHVAATTSAA
jgi:hypothetical protein